MRLDKVAHHTDVRSFKNPNSRSGSDWRKGKAFTGGDLTHHELAGVRSQQKPY